MSEVRDAAERVERALREHPLSWHVDVDAYDVQLLVEHATVALEALRNIARDHHLESEGRVSDDANVDAVVASYIERAAAA